MHFYWYNNVITKAAGFQDSKKTPEFYDSLISSSRNVVESYTAYFNNTGTKPVTSTDLDSLDVLVDKCKATFKAVFSEFQSKPSAKTFEPLEKAQNLAKDACSGLVMDPDIERPLKETLTSAFEEELEKAKKCEGVVDNASLNILEKSYLATSFFGNTLNPKQASQYLCDLYIRPLMEVLKDSQKCPGPTEVFNYERCRMYCDHETLKTHKITSFDLKFYYYSKIDGSIWKAILAVDQKSSDAHYESVKKWLPQYLASPSKLTSFHKDLKDYKDIEEFIRKIREARVIINSTIEAIDRNGDIDYAQVNSTREIAKISQGAKFK